MSMHKVSLIWELKQRSLWEDYRVSISFSSYMVQCNLKLLSTAVGIIFTAD